MSYSYTAFWEGARAWGIPQRGKLKSMFIEGLFCGSILLCILHTLAHLSLKTTSSEEGVSKEMSLVQWSGKGQN